MKQCLFMLLVFALPALAQKGNIGVRYDKFKDVTVIETPFMGRLDGPGSKPMTMGLMTAYPGSTKPVTPPPISMYFDIESPSSFLRPSLILMADDTRITSTKVRDEYVSLRHHLIWANVTLDELNQLASAKTVSGQLNGAFEFTINANHQRIFAQIVDHFR